MMKFLGNKNLKIVAATCVTMFSLLAVFSGCFAWFSLNKEVNSSGEVNIEQISGYFHKLTIHNAVNISDEKYQFDTNPWGSITVKDWDTKTLDYSFESGSCFMGSYGVLEKIHPVLFLFELGDDTVTNYVATSEAPINITAKTDIDYYIGDGVDGRTIYADNEINVASGKFNPLSSVVRFSSRTFATSADLGTITKQNGFTNEEGDTYNTFDFDSNSLSNPGSFVNFDTNNSYDSFNSEPVIYSNDSTAVKYIAVVFDYYEFAVESIYGAFLGNEVLSNEITFTCDWTMVI